ncbi:DUF4249 domain-containing protein [Bacteroidota bacterium]
MRVSKLLGIGFHLLCTYSCIESFHPEIKETQDQLVVSGNISDQPGWHYVEVSRSSPFNDPHFIPVRGCVVRVEDENGQGINYSEDQPGVYRADLDESFLGVNKAYKLYVYTQDGEEYQSDYDSLLACPPVDSLYYEIEKHESEDTNVTYLGGIQFYVDVKGKAGDSRNFLWKLEETYEYRAAYLIQYFWDTDSVYEFDPPSDSLARCYKSGSISEIYTASSRHLVANELNRYPLSFVSGKFPQLRFKYGLMVTQYSLSDEAFLYWENMRTLTYETGGMYEKQPASADGNIYNVNDPEEQVLGFFYASQERQKWIVLKRPFLMYILDFTCWLEIAVLDDLNEECFLVSVDLDGLGPPYGYGDQACFDCRLLDDGILEPPFYWTEDE